MSTGDPKFDEAAAAARAQQGTGLKKPNAVLNWIKNHAEIVTVLGAFFAMLVTVLGGFAWISEKFTDIRGDLARQMTDVRHEISAAQKETQKDIGDLRVEVGKQGGKLEQIDTRLNRLEERMNAKFGADSPDAGPPGPWSPEHVGRRSKFCDQRCKQDAACQKQCVADYNLCGIRCPTNPITTCFTGCIDALRNVPSAGP